MEKNQQNVLNILQELFRCSPEYVLLADFTLCLLWQNRISQRLSGVTCATLFGGRRQEEIQNGTYSFQTAGEFHRFRVFRFPTEEAAGGGYFVLFLDETEALQALLQLRDVREYLENWTGQIRQSVTGIASAGSMLHQLQVQRGTNAAETEWLNIILHNCYLLLKSTTLISDSIRYAENSGEPEQVDLGQMLQQFTTICSSLLKDVLELHWTPAEEELFVRVPQQRLLACLLGMLLMVRGDEPLYNSIAVQLSADETQAIISVVGAPGGPEQVRQTALYPNMPLYAGKDLQGEKYLILRFCEAFSCRFEEQETPGRRCCRLLLPLADLADGCVCRSAPELYAEDRFSRIHVALSGLVQEKFFSID